MTDEPDDQLPKVSIPEVSIEAIDIFRNTSNYLSSYVQTIDRAMAGLREYVHGDILNNLQALTAGVNGWATVLTDAIEGTVKNHAAKEALRERGILPHKSTPWHLFTPEKRDEFADLVLAYYSNEWDQARAVFLADLDAYPIGEEAKEAFGEGLECHTSKLYRPAILTVLPAAETEFRRTFAIAPGQPAASLEELRRAIMDAPAGVMLSHVAPLDLFETLDNHLYEKVRTQEDVERLAADPIPNRHAAIHGLIPYKSELSSINALILTDYVFFLISQIEKYLAPAR